MIDTTKGFREAFIGQDDEFWDIEPGGEDYGCEFRKTGVSGVACTGYALEIWRKLGGERVKLYGFFLQDNEDSEIAMLSGGHDFAVVDDRWIVDPWVSDIEQMDVSGVYDLADEGDQEKILRLYGDREKWQQWPPQDIELALR